MYFEILRPLYTKFVAETDRQACNARCKIRSKQVWHRSHDLVLCFWNLYIYRTAEDIEIKLSVQIAYKEYCPKIRAAD